MPRFGSLKWLVPFVKGNLTAVAYDAQGQIAGMKTVLSAGRAERVQVTLADPYSHGRNSSQIAADGQDVALVTVKLVDARGVIVPNADVNVTLTVLGPGRVIGT